MREREGPAAAKSGSLHHPVRSSPPSPKFHLNKGRYGHIRDAEYNSRIYLYLWRSSLQVVFRWCPLLVPWCGRDLVRGPLSGWVWTRRSADPGRVVTSNVQEKVNQAEHCGEAIDNNVLDWLQDTDKASQGVDTFMDEKVVKENMWFCNFLGPDFIWCYRLSKQAEKKAVSIKQLAKKGSEIGTVSHPREDPLELELPSSKDYEDFNSRQKVFKGIVEALKDSNVNMIGVYGTGGVGKTTMVAKVVKLLKEDKIFDEVVMAVVSKDANVREIQGQLADRLNL